MLSVAPCQCNPDATLPRSVINMGMSASSKMYLILIVLVLFGSHYGDCKQQKTSRLYFLKVRSYEHDLNKSLEQDKSDKQAMTSWAEEFQLKQVRLMADYKIQMMKHRDHNFRSNVSRKWEDCIHIYQRTINKMETDYNEEESLCVRTAMIDRQEKEKDVVQIEKEKRKWRKGYKYVENLCKTNFNTDIEIRSCLVEYIEKDHYNLSLQRLITLKTKLMHELSIQYNKIIFDLGECLRINLYKYLYNVRLIMKVLERCYLGKRN